MTHSGVPCYETTFRCSEISNWILIFDSDEYKRNPIPINEGWIKFKNIFKSIESVKKHLNREDVSNEYFNCKTNQIKLFGR